jgi:hypothetical protein
MLPSQQLSSESLHVSVVLKKHYFEVPENQRDYRWEEQNREKLWKDILLTDENDHYSDRPKALGHFMGSIVVVGRSESLESNRWKVVDGQQRLTTLTILADCLRPYVDKITDKIKKKNLTRTLEDCVSASEYDGAPRIKLNKERVFYEESLLNNDSFDEKQSYWDAHYNEKSEVQTNIKSAFEFFNREINKHLLSYAEEERNDRIISLADTIMKGLYFLIVRVDSIWMAYRIFETLNERGLDLTQAELIKNVMIEHVSQTGAISIEKIDSKWNEFVFNYENQPAKKLDMPHLIQFSYSYRRKLVNREDIFDVVSNNLRSGDLDVGTFSNNIEIDSRNWSLFLLGDLVNWSDEQSDSQFAIVDPLWKKHCAPYILAVMDKLSEDQKKLERSLLLCEHYLFRQGLVCRDSVGALQKVFSKAASLVRANVNLDEVAEYFKKMSPDKIFVDSFKTYSVKNMKQGFYTIWKIENQLSKKGSIEFRPKSQSAAQHLEHIMPKKPGPEWGGIEKEDGFNSMLNRVGNFLVLSASINQHIKNKSIDYKMKNEKCEDYASSELKLPVEFNSLYKSWAVKSQWNFEAINLRQAYLAEKYALATWTLE